MPKGQQRGNREAKKPKAPRPPAPIPSRAGLPAQATPTQNPPPRGSRT
jgi:hypothetical protein